MDITLSSFLLGREQDFNTNKIQSLLGYRPIVNYQLGLKETVKWIKKAKPEH